MFVDVLGDTSIDDGISFDVAALEAGPIREDQAYGGVRLTTTARLERAEIEVKIDIGFGTRWSLDVVDRPTSPGRSSYR